MRRLRLKVCGLNQSENIAEVARLEPDMMGFIFYPLSPRNAFRLDPDQVKKIGGSIQKVGVFVNEPKDRVLSIVQEYDLDVMQLHGEESPSYCNALKRSGRQLMKVFSGNALPPREELEVYAEYVDGFLLDHRGVLKGGGGVAFDHRPLQENKFPYPYWLAGGMTPSLVKQIITHPYHNCIGLDLNSGFEDAPGIKSIEKLKKILS
jgi:phosphoribosylanthranilate isomerase